MSMILSTRLLSAVSLSAALLVSCISVALVSTSVQAQEVKASDKKTRKVPTLRSKVYEQLARAQAAADEDKIDEAIEILSEVEDKMDSMNSYERAMMYNFYGFIYYNAEQYDKALDSFAQVVEQQPIPEKFEMTTLFSLAQLNLMQGNYDKSIQYLERWEALNPGPVPPKNLILKAQAYYQNKDYAKAEPFIAKAIADHEAEGMIPDENWLILQRAIYYELKQPEKVKNVLIKLVKLFDEPKYWIQLAGMYGELGEERKQLAIMESAYQRGYIESPADIFNLAQLYYYHKVPYKGALLMEQAMEQGTLEKNLRNLRFLGQSWTLAKEQDKAIPAMQSAAEMSEDGELDAQLAQILLNAERWDEAISAADNAVQKGDLRNPGIVHLIKGMALYNKKQYALALNELAEAEKHQKSKAMAQQWKRFVATEKTQKERLQADI
ncbi:lipopolysaccharide assembly protein LapB [Aestuariibacter sp. A3R04]|uniref:tetratricopeptide repeat protein n=1 Tax=Aestuariibacter sp. A3R04 TaxID=2841571 RepID=UPI001C099DDB|nr:tetratricopeptide repeat protein [Aestuariibacter sp. A3R04]MBU3020985.1 tetratricopeptide repeat protein [Aestuariibacter sp. A3R04]